MDFKVNSTQFLSSQGVPYHNSAEVDSLHIEVAKLKREVASLTQENENLFQKLLLMQIRQYGPKSEKNALKNHQGFNLFGDTLTGGEEAKQNQEDEENQEEKPKKTEEDDNQQTKPKNKRKSGGRKAFPSHLEREDIKIILPASERHCPFHGTLLEFFKWETIEKLEVIPAKVKVYSIQREVLHCPACEGKNIVTAPHEPTLFSKASVTDSTVAHFMVQKFLDGMPIYRQVEALKRQGVELSRSTVSSWFLKATDALEPIAELIKEHCLAQAVIYVDETTLQVLNEPGRKAQQKSYMWVMATQQDGTRATYFHYNASRSTDSLKELIGHDFSGYVHCDAYAAYKSYTKDTNTTLVGCWSHVRRRFVEALKVSGKSKKSLAHYAVASIDELFKIERKYKQATPEEKLQVRQEKSLPILTGLFDWAEDLVPNISNNTFGRAIKYMLGQKQELSEFISHHDLELSNNFAERIIKTFAIGRKAWLFSNTPNGAKSSAIASSILITCKLNQIEPHAYISSVFKRIASGDTHYEDMLPWNFPPHK